VVFVVLLINGLLEFGFVYQLHKVSLIRIQREQTEGAAAQIGQFIREIESQVGLTTQLLGDWPTLRGSSAQGRNKKSEIATNDPFTKFGDTWTRNTWHRTDGYFEGDRTR
jgi:hypothetical protein